MIDLVYSLNVCDKRRATVEEKKQEYDNSVILFNCGYCYVLAVNYGLMTVYKNDSVRI